MNNKVIRVAAHAAIGVAIVAVVGVVVMLLWNWIIPPITGWSTICWPQAIGLICLSKLLGAGLWNPRRGRRHGHLSSELAGMSREQKRDYLRAHFTANEE